MMRTLSLGVCLGACICLGATDPGALKNQMELGDWFQLRGEVTQPGTPAFFKGAVAAGFDDARTARMYFAAVLQSNSDIEQVKEVHRQLFYLYLRSGQYRKTAEESAALLKLDPTAEDVKGLNFLFSSIAKYPEMSVRHSGHTLVKMTEDRAIPVTVEGKPARYIFDTGMNIPIMSEKEATRLGLAIHESAWEMHDYVSGKGSPARFVIVKRLAIGSVELRNIAFVVLPNSAPLFVDQPPDKQGSLGLPQLHALGRIRWSKNLDFEIFPDSQKGEPNLCFHNATPLLNVTSGDRQINAYFDTGSDTTYLTPRFAREFPEMMKGGKKAKTEFAGFSASASVDVTTLPSFSMNLAGLEITKDDIDVLPIQEAVNRDQYHVWLGMDVLANIGTVTVDFRSMTVKIEQ